MSLSDKSIHDLVDKLLNLKSCTDIKNYLFMELSIDCSSRCRNFLSSCCPRTFNLEVKVFDRGDKSLYNICLLRMHFYRLNPDRKLYDETVNAFMLLLDTYDARKCLSESTRTKSHFFFSELFTKVIFLG